MGNEQVWTQVIIGISAIITTYIATKHGAKITNKLRGTTVEAPPPDRYGVMFDGYERLIKEQQQNLDVKEAKIQRLEDSIDQLQVDLDKSRVLAAELRNDNETKQRVIKKLEASVSSMRKKYDDNWENGVG